MWFWKQSTGTLRHNGQIVHTGYSGLGEGKNNPAKQDAKGVGPIPVGRYRMTEFGDSQNVGPNRIVLEPEPGTETFGRGDFRIHGDSAQNPGRASHGCIVIGGGANRKAIWDSGDHELTVVA